MYLKKEIYNNFLQQLSENSKIPRAVLRDVKKLFNEEKLITSTQLKMIIEREVTHDLQD